MKLTDSQRCNFCFLYTQSIKHLFWECLCVHNVWLLIKQRIIECFHLNLEIDEKIVLFGIQNPQDLQALNTINKVILYTKFFIYKCKLNNEEVMFNKLVIYINKMCELSFVVFDSFLLESVQLSVLSVTLNIFISVCVFLCVLCVFNVVLCLYLYLFYSFIVQYCKMKEFQCNV